MVPVRSWRSGVSRSAATATAVVALLGALRAHAQVTIDVENRYSNVGALMVWRVDESGRLTQLAGFASGTLIGDRVMVTAGHFTAPAKAGIPANVRIFASFSPTDARNPKSWIPVVSLVPHPSMPHCPPPPQCDPTHEILVAPLEPGIADVGLVFLAHAPQGIAPATFADHEALETAEGTPTLIVGYGTTVPSTDTSIWDGQRRVRTSRVRKVVDETWALWSIPSYVCSGDSGGAIFLSTRADEKSLGRRLVANVSDGGRDCRRHNNNNRLDTRAIQQWIADTIRQQAGKK
jgi:hypothetical protein